MKIAVFIAESPWGDLDETTLNRGLGGRETALVQLALNWAEQGNEVYAFVPRDDVRHHVASGGGVVSWIPNEGTIEVCQIVRPDVFVSWENVVVLEMLRQTGYKGLTAIEMQVAHLESHIPVTSVADYVCVLSEWAGEFLGTQHPDLRSRHIKVFPNGVDLARFERALTMPREELGLDGNRAHFIYSSSPDRGLHHLLRMWPGLRQAVQMNCDADAELHVCYGIENFVAGSKWSHREDGQRAIQIEKMINQDGVTYHGKVGQQNLAELMVGCDLMLYPCDTMSPTETGCISIVEALAAGTPVVTTDCDCIKSEFEDVTIQHPLPFRGAEDYRDYAIKVIDALDDDYETRAEAGRKFAQWRSWKLIAEDWAKFFEETVA